MRQTVLSIHLRFRRALRRIRRLNSIELTLRSSPRSATCPKKVRVVTHGAHARAAAADELAERAVAELGVGAAADADAAGPRDGERHAEQLVVRQYMTTPPQLDSVRQTQDSSSFTVMCRIARSCR
jgi:hypothetical protein